MTVLSQIIDSCFPQKYYYDNLYFKINNIMIDVTL